MMDKGTIRATGESLEEATISLQYEHRSNKRQSQTNSSLGPATKADDEVRSKISDASMLFGIQ